MHRINVRVYRIHHTRHPQLTRAIIIFKKFETNNMPIITYASVLYLPSRTEPRPLTLRVVFVVH